MKDAALIGGGTAGVRAAVELDDRKAHVVLIEEKFYIGGKLTELSRIYPVCELYFAPHFFFQLYDSPNVEIFTGSRVSAIEKHGDIYCVTIRSNPRYVTDKCTLCLECVKVCDRKAIQKPPFFSVPPAVFINREKCGKCRKCEKICPEGAIVLDEKEKSVERKVKTVLVSTGAPLFDAEKYSEYGYNRFSDVITSIELEKMLHPSYELRFKTSTGKIPEKIAFVQCVGSRDVVKGEAYCSSFCCMQALNEARVLKERYPDCESLIFFTDMQCSKKGWQKFYETAKTMGVTSIRSRVSSIYEEKGIVYCTSAQEQLKVDQVDIAVLSVGILPPDPLEVELHTFDMEENQFLRLYAHPVDITESVEEALAAVCHIGAFLPSVDVEVSRKMLEPGVQVFLCTCGNPTSANLYRLAEELRKEGYLVSVFQYLCREEGKEAVQKLKKEKVVVGACSLHQNLFERLLCKKGEGPFLEIVNMKNVKNQERPIRIGIAKMEHLNTADVVCLQDAATTRNSHSPVKIRTKIIPEVVVIGGGVSGLTAALELADYYNVYVVEKRSQLGGRALHIEYSLGYSPRQLVQTMVTRVEAHPNITVLTDTEVIDVAGKSGNFSVRTAEKKITCGAIIVAVGAKEFEPEIIHPRIVTQIELEEIISTGRDLGVVVMVQCYGSRSDEHPWCSAYCCLKAVSSSLKIKEQKDAQVIVLYKDMRTYGIYDTYYREARRKGVLFLQNDDMPSIRIDGDAVEVQYYDPILDAQITIEPDLLVLSTGIVPRKGAAELAQVLGIKLDGNGFFRELHPKFYPTDSSRDGIFLCGACHSPQNVKEIMIQARAAASRVVTLFCSEIVESANKVTVDDVCTQCGICVEVCPFGALSDGKDGTVHITMSICADCGICVSSCPVGALDQTMLSDEQLLRMVEAV